MKEKDISAHRLYNQLVASPALAHAHEVVSSLGALQAQDYLASLWAVGIRMRQATEAFIENALAEGTIIRSWPLRGTLHLVAAADIRWMLALTSARIIARHTNRMKQEYELDEKVFTRCRKIIEQALQGGNQIQRETLYEILETAKIKTGNQRGLQILWRLAQDGVICFGARAGKQQTFVLLDEWIPESKALQHDEALAKLALRYFTSRGPASLQDFTWWSGLSTQDAKAGFELVKSALISETFEAQTYWMAPPQTPKKNSAKAYLLPAFDEYLLGYANRSAVLDMENFRKRVATSNGIFNPIVVMNNRVMGTWKRTLKKDTLQIEIQPFAPLHVSQQKAIGKAAEMYSAFMQKPVTYKPGMIFS